VQIILEFIKFSKKDFQTMIQHKFKLKSAVFIYLLFASISCISERNYGPVETEIRDVGSFNEIEVGSGINVFLTMGNNQSLQVETSEDLMEKLVTEVRGGKLKIYFEGNVYWVRTANVYVEAEEIKRINASGGSDVKGEDEIRSEELRLNASGGSDIRLRVNVDELDVEVSGGADIELIGTANYMEANTSGGSDLKAYDLVARVAQLEASGGSDIKITVEDEIKARASGGADIKYAGNPRKVNINDSSGGDVKAVN
jgi:hypothetical protein